MGSVATAMISFGVDLGDDPEFPWLVQRDMGADIYGWWREIHGFEELHQPYTHAGGTDDYEYADGWDCNDPRFKDYFAYRNKWLEENPLPVELQYYSHYGCGFTQLIIPGLGLKCDWSDVVSIDFSKLVVPDTQRVALQSFLQTHDFKPVTEPGWMLSCRYS